MQNTIVITGKRGSGKSSLALAIIGDRPHLQMELHELRSNFRFANVTNKHKVILIDEGSIHHADLANLKELITAKTITVNKKFHTPFDIERPDLIITATELPEELMTRRRNLFIIECK